MPQCRWPSPILALGWLLSACDSRLPQPEVTETTLVGYLDPQLAMGPRFPGSPGHQRMKAWLDSMVRVRADTVVIDDWTHVTSRQDTLSLRNLLARFRPNAPARLLFVAHWDTRPRADGPASSDTLAPVLGANDGASGVAILLGVADALHRQAPSVGVDLLFVDGEDFGSFADTTQTLLGARRYAQSVTTAQHPRFAIVWDMLGDRDLHLRPEGNSLLAAPDLVADIWALAIRLGYGDHFETTPGVPITDDQLPLQRAGIRAVDLIDLEYGPGNRWHHSPEDTRDKVSSRSLFIAAHLATALIRRERP
jgi:glutaminyl-peptide cyclotransferase